MLSVNAAAVALDVAEGVAGALAAEALYADLNTSSPGLKRELADALPVRFADVALVGVVPSLGLATPALASGAGAERFAELFRPARDAGRGGRRAPGRRRRPEAPAKRLHEGPRGGRDREPRGRPRRRRRGPSSRRHRRGDRRAAPRAAALGIARPTPPGGSTR